MKRLPANHLATTPPRVPRPGSRGVGDVRGEVDERLCSANVRPPESSGIIDEKNKTVLITGGACGIGGAIAEALAARGAHVLIADRQAAVAVSPATPCSTPDQLAERLDRVADDLVLRGAKPRSDPAFDALAAAIGVIGAGAAAGAGRASERPGMRSPGLPFQRRPSAPPPETYAAFLPKPPPVADSVQQQRHAQRPPCPSARRETPSSHW